MEHVRALSLPTVEWAGPPGHSLRLSPHAAVRDHRDVYAVVSGDGCVVTVGHRYKRVMRDKSLVNKRPRGWRR